MLTYHDIDTLLIESEQYLEDLFAELEEMMLGNRKDIPAEVIDGSEESNKYAGETSGNLPDTAGGQLV